MRNQFQKRVSVVGAAAAHEISPFVVRDLEKTIDPHSHLPGKHNCGCLLCRPGRFPSGPLPNPNVFHSNSKESSRWFRRILEGLTVSGARTLRLFLPDILFVEGESVEVFQSSRKDGRVARVAGLTPLKLVYPTFLRLRREYKTLLEQSYNQQMLDKINPEFMHLKYFQKLVPGHFDAGNDSATLERNKHHFRRYVLHNDQKYQIQQIEEHKMNEKEPFCLVKYTDGNCTLLNQAEFELYTLTPIPKIAADVAYFQSYIKYKLESDSILFSHYTYTSTQLDQELDRRAEREVMVLLGGLTRYDEDYKDIETLEELSVDLMLHNQKEYADLMTYKIVHYLAMASRIYLTHLKLKWILNDIGTVYLQEIMELELTDLPPRIIKFRLPPTDDSPDFYHANNHFVDIYSDMKKRKAINTLIIKKDIDAKTYDEILTIMDPTATAKQDQTIDTNPAPSQRQRLPAKRSKADSEASRTIDITKSKPPSPTNFQTIPVVKASRYHNFSTYEEHLRQHPEIVMKNRPYNSTSLARYSEAPGKVEKVDRKINNHFIFNMSSEDYKTFSPDEKPTNTARLHIQEYLDRRKERVSHSLLYSTFHQLNSQRLKQVNETLKKEQLSKSRDAN